MINITELAGQYGTPIFVIDLDKIKDNFLRFKKSFLDSIVAYSYKTNFHPEILRLLKKCGCFAEAISPQEIYFAEKVGVNTNKIIYNGLGRGEKDFENALSKNLFIININSKDELKRISIISRKLKKEVPIGIRINPKFIIEDKKSFMKNSRFGIGIKEWSEILEIIDKNKFLNLKGIFAHIGTNITNPHYFVKVFKILDSLAKDKMEYIDLGGGFASESILNESKKSIFDFGKEINKINTRKYKLVFEPGRYIVEDACYCITKILSINRGWVITDIAGNFLIPLANANYRVKLPKGDKLYNFGGNLCFSADIIQKNVKTRKLNVGEIIKIENTGAYTFSMRNNLGNSDPVILIKEKGKIRKYKDKGDYEELFKNMI